MESRSILDPTAAITWVGGYGCGADGTGGGADGGGADGGG